MDKHILFLIDHLANTSKYTQEQLEVNARTAAIANRVANRESAWAAYWAAYTDDSAYWAADWAAYSAAAYAADAAAYWVDEYFKITGEDKKTYLDKLGE
jgi:hypothetical protein